MTCAAQLLEAMGWLPWTLARSLLSGVRSHVVGVDDRGTDDSGGREVNEESVSQAKF